MRDEALTRSDPLGDDLTAILGLDRPRPRSGVRRGPVAAGAAVAALIAASALFFTTREAPMVPPADTPARAPAARIATAPPPATARAATELPAVLIPQLPPLPAPSIAPVAESAIPDRAVPDSTVPNRPANKPRPRPVRPAGSQRGHSPAAAPRAASVHPDRVADVPAPTRNATPAATASPPRGSISAGMPKLEERPKSPPPSSPTVTETVATPPDSQERAATKRRRDRAARDGIDALRSLRRQ